MQDTDVSTDAASSASSAAAALAAPTPLVAALGQATSSLIELGGALSLPQFADVRDELAALTQTAGVYDLGERAQIAIGGEDRVRWLNGMLTNNIQGLPEGAGNYNFVLNAQGRTQGDVDAYRLADRLLLTTDRSQVAALLAHFDHFIIMDDVTLDDLSLTRTAVGLAGPHAPQILETLGVTLPPSSDGQWLIETVISGIAVQVTGSTEPGVPSFALWCAPEHVLRLWQVLLGAGAVPCGWRAVEAVRVLAGVPRYGMDIRDRDLPQETGQMRALHFGKGCYLGQEIVERIRSRGNVHRRLAVFRLSAEPSELPLHLHAGDQQVGQITSIAPYQGTLYGIGIVRAEAAERHNDLNFLHGTATLLPQPPLARM